MKSIYMHANSEDATKLLETLGIPTKNCRWVSLFFNIGKMVEIEAGYNLEVPSKESLEHIETIIRRYKLVELETEPTCAACGSVMTKNKTGGAYTCSNCGETSGCS